MNKIIMKLQDLQASLASSIFLISSFLFLISCGVFTACDDDLERATVSGFESSELIASATDVTLSLDNSKKVVLSFAWTKPTLLSSDAELPVTDNLVSATLQASASASFASYQETVVTSLSTAYTGSALNTLAKDLGLAADVASPVYFRIATTEGANLDPAYSNVCTVNVTPFTIYMTDLTVVSSNKADTLAVLHSPDETGIYSGWMHATAWLNWWGIENDGTTWGNAPVDGQAFKAATSTDGAWNFWFPDGGGDFYVTLDTKAKEWYCTLITGITANGQALTYDAKKDRWTYYGTFAAGSSLSIAAETKTWNYATQTAADAATVGTMELGYTGSIAADGDYTLVISPNADALLQVNVVEGEIKDEPEEGTPIPSQLFIYNTEKDTQLAAMAQTEKGIYTGKIVASQWQNFLLYDAENDIWYGSDPADQFGLANAGYWNIWTNDDYENGSVIAITADLNTLKWSYASVTMPATLDLYDTGKSAVKVSLQPTDRAGVYSGVYAAQQWENFLAYDAANETWYGCAPVDGGQYTLATGEYWNIWVNDDFESGANITLTFDIVGMTWSYTVGGGTEPDPNPTEPDDPVVSTPIPTTLYLYDKGKENQLAQLSATETPGVFTCTYTPSAWENFLLRDAENDLWYGASPTEGQYKLYSGSDAWDIWFNDDVDGQTPVTVTVNLNELSWSYSK